MRSSSRPGHRPSDLPLRPHSNSTPPLPSSTLRDDHRNLPESFQRRSTRPSELMWSNTTSANTSRQASNASIFSMPFGYPQSRHPTPPTPLSPGLYRPPSQPLYPQSDGTPDNPAHHLHPSQYRAPERRVRETHNLDVDYDPVSGRKMINNYAIIEEIGRGTHGKVKLGMDMTTGQTVAIKIVERSQGRERLGRKNEKGANSEIKVRREIAILKKIRHPNVVQLLEVIDDARFKKVYLVLEYVVRGEVVWRKPADADLIRRDRRRARREAAQDLRAKLAAVDGSRGGEQWGTEPRRRKRKEAPFWSLEFASSSGEDGEEDGNDLLDDFSDTESISDLQPDDYYMPAMDIDEARRCFRDTVIGLDYLHYNGIIHRDIKPANLLWTDNKDTKISDFGVSFLGRPIRKAGDIDDDDEEPTGFEQDELELAKTAGTPAFFAPELCTLDPLDNDRPTITNAIDVWALGITLFCFIYGRVPFIADHEFSLFKVISEDELKIPHRRIRPKKPELQHGCRLTPEQLEEYETEPVEESLRDLISKLLVKNQEKRITLREVKKHPWVVQGLEDPRVWIETTDPEVGPQASKIEVTAEDVEFAVSTPNLITRAKSAIRKATGSWVRGLRKRGSTTMGSSEQSSAISSPIMPPMDSGSEGVGKKQGQPNFINIRQNTSEKELLWMGRIAEEEKLTPLAPSITNSSTGSSETVKQSRSADTDDEPHHSTSNPGSNSHKLRRKRSINLLGGLRRHTSQSTDMSKTIRETHRGPTEAPPPTPLLPPSHICRSESTAALQSTNVGCRIVRASKSEDISMGHRMLPSDNSLDQRLTAREFLTETLQAQPTSKPTDTLPTQMPQPHRLYTVHDEAEPLYHHTSTSPRSMSMKEKYEQQRREEQQMARMRLKKAGLEGHSVPEDDDGDSPQTQEPSWQTSSYYPTTSTPPIPVSGHHKMSYFDQVPPTGANIASSSSEEKFNNTAGSSFSNSASLQYTNPSSVSSESNLPPFSRKGSVVSREDDDRVRRNQPRRGSFIFHHSDDEDDEETDSDSEGGFVLKPTISRQSPARRLSRTQTSVEVPIARRGTLQHQGGVRRLRDQSGRSSGTARGDDESIPREERV